MTDKTPKAVETALALGAKGYRGARPVEGVIRFDREVMHRHLERDVVSSGNEMLANPSAVPLLMTADGVLWQPAEFGERLLANLRAIAEAVGIPCDGPLDGVYRKVEELAEAAAREPTA